MPTNKDLQRKQFECKPDCKNRYLDAVVLSCHDCIKHFSMSLSAKQKREIIKILKLK